MTYPGCGHSTDDPNPPRSCPLCSTFGRASVRRTPGKMNKLETRYSQHLDVLKMAGEVHEWWFEAIAFRIGERGFWHPDFLVQMTSGMLEIHDTKGHVKDDALVKAKSVAERFPFTVLHVKWDSKQKQWKIRSIGR